MSAPKILYIAPLKDFSGYATAARNYVISLAKTGRCDLVTRHVTYDGGGYIPNLLEKTIANKTTSEVDIVIQQLTPNECEPRPDVFNVLYFAWETDKVPNEWVKQINKMDLAFVPCEANVIAARVAGVKIPVVKMPHTFDVENYKKAVPFDIAGFESHMKFLSICQASKKKGIDSLLFAYLAEFTAADETLLILKTYFGPSDGDAERNAMLQQVENIKNILRLDRNAYPRVLVLHGVSSDTAIEKLYATSDCYVLPSRGEGWGIPHFEALCYGIPSIGSDWGGTSEFINNKNGWLVKSVLEPCHAMPHPHSFMYTAADNWAEPSINDIRRAMRAAFHEWRTSKHLGDASNWSRRKSAALESVKPFSHSAIGNKMMDVIEKYYSMWKVKRGY